MLQTVLKSSLTAFGQHFQIYRLSSSVVLKGYLPHHRLPHRHCFDSFCCKSCNVHSGTNGGGHGWEDKGKPKWKYGKYLGFLGATAVFGMGTVLSKSQEDEKHFDKSMSESVKMADQSILTAESKETEEWKDVVATEKAKSGDGNQIVSVRTAGPSSASADTAAVEALHCISEEERQDKLEEVVKKARQLLRLRMHEAGIPGLVVSVTVNGKPVWADGFGFADLENHVRCSPATVMRIASISKALTMTAVARLWEEGKLDLDAPIQEYIPDFPVKTFDGEEVTITTRQLISHLSGIRHYKVKDSRKWESKSSQKGSKKNMKECCHSVKEGEKRSEGAEKKKVKEKIEVMEDKDKDNEGPSHNESNIKQSEKEDATFQPLYEKKGKIVLTDESNADNTKEMKEKTPNGNAKCSCTKLARKEKFTREKKDKKKKEDEDEFDLKEYHIKEEFDTIQDAIKLFQDDELFFKPGSDFLYTTHGWTLVSAVVEAAAQMPFTEAITRLFYELGLDNTYLDKASPIIYNRASYYIRGKNWRLKNAPYVNNSYKWAGGGFLSTVGDLCKFGNSMLYASQQDSHGGEKGVRKLPGYLKASTMQNLWTPVKGTNKGWRDKGYGMGWEAVEDKSSYGFCRRSQQHAFHTGGAVGASSILLVLPKQDCGERSATPPQGVVVAILANMQGVGLHTVALEIAELFWNSQ